MTHWNQLTNEKATVLFIPKTQFHCLLVCVYMPLQHGSDIHLCSIGLTLNAAFSVQIYDINKC